MTSQSPSVAVSGVPASRATNDAHSYRIPVLQLASGPNATNGAMVYLSGGPGCWLQARWCWRQ